MSSKTCANCGAVLENAEGMKYCPYCSAEYKKDADELDFDKFKIQHDETVRHNKWKENQEEKKREDRRFRLEAIALVIFVILVTVFTGIESIINAIAGLFR